MNKILMACGFAACLPLVAQADNLELGKELNGLDIQTKATGTAIAGGPGPDVVGGVQALEITNNSNVTVSCQLKPEPTETTMAASPRTLLKAGEKAVLRVGGSYSSVTARAKLTCERAN